MMESLLIKLNDTQVVAITRFGLLLESVLPASYKSLPMPDAVADLLSPKSTISPTEITSLITPALRYASSTVDPYTTLVKLELFIKDFAANDSLTTRIAASAIVLTILSLVSVCLRFYAKIFIAKRVRSHDWMALFSFFISVIMTGFCLYACTHYGLGKHAWRVSFDDLVSSVKLMIASTYVVQPGLFCIKASLVMYFITLVPGRRVYKKFALASIAVLSALMVVGVFVATFQCTPVDYWNNFLQTKCLPRGGLTTVRVLTTLGSDAIVFAMSIPVIGGRKYNEHERIVVGFIYTLGVFSCVATVIRLVKTATFMNHPDKTYNVSPVIIWTMVEVNIAILVSNLPLMNGIVLKNFPALLGYDKASAEVALAHMETSFGSSLAEERRDSDNELQHCNKSDISERVEEV